MRPLMDFQLVVVKGRSQANAFKLADGITTVGRQDDCELRIKSSQVSRRHCQLFEKKGMLMVKDLGSSNGVFVNGKRINEQQVLEPGDEITIGQVTFRVEKLGQPASTVAKPMPAKAGDTAITDAIIDDSSDEEFEIDFDEEPAKPAPKPAPAPVPAPAVAVVPVKPIPPSAAPIPTPTPAPAPVVEENSTPMADDAVADFLLNIKLDDD